MRVFIIVIVCLLALAGGIAAVAIKVRVAFSTPPPPITVRVEKASEGNLIEIISAPGEVQPRTKVSISAKVSAPIIELPFKEGDRVVRGKSVLVRLDAKDLQAALKSAQARFDAQGAAIAVSEKRIEANKSTIDSMKANLLDATRDLTRQIGLLKTNDVSQSVVDTAQTKVDAMKAQMQSSEFSIKADEANLTVEKFQREAASADVSRATDDLSYTIIFSPIDGVVTRRKAEVGEMVVPGIQNSPGTTIMEVGDLSQMLMVARIDESNITQVLPASAHRCGCPHSPTRSSKAASNGRPIRAPIKTPAAPPRPPPTPRTAPATSNAKSACTRTATRSAPASLPTPRSKWRGITV